MLSDPQNRRVRSCLILTHISLLMPPQVYDLHGVWPPPEPSAGPSQHRRPDMGYGYDQFFGEPFRDTFFSMPRMSHFDHHHYHRPQSYTFTDPFRLFNSMFGDIHQVFDQDAFFDEPHHGPPRPMFEPSHVMFAPPPMFSLPLFADQSFEGSRPRRATYSSSSRFHSQPGRDGNGPRWVEESHMTRTINGVTQSISKQTDSSVSDSRQRLSRPVTTHGYAQGNEHVTYEYPDGRKRYTINGVEQQQHHEPPAVGSSSRHDRVIPPLPPPLSNHMPSGVVPPFARSSDQPNVPQQSQVSAAFYPYDGTPSAGHSKRFRPYSNGSGPYSSGEGMLMHFCEM